MGSEARSSGGSPFAIRADRDQLDQTTLARADSAQLLRRSYENAFDLLTSSRVQSAFDLATENDRTRDRYGRDHWARAMSIAFAGAGVRGGQVIGATNLDVGEVIDRRYTPYDYAETIYRKLGIDTDQRLHKADGLPVEFTNGGQPIRELF